jgi:hypothetical protein
MSYLAKPRIGFFASDAMTNPSTANNENVLHLLDYDNVKLINPPAVEGGDLPRMSDAAYREWMTTLITYSDPLDQIPDPTQPNWRPAMPGYWNYWGDHMTTFGGATVTSAWLDDEPVTTPGSDPLLGANVVFNARIVDLNPADTYCSLFVAAGFSVIGPDVEGNLAELMRGVPTTAMTRWLNFYRYYGAGTFQAVIPNAGLSFIDEARAPDSPALRALREGARGGGGLLLRWCFYGMKAAKSMTDMYDLFQQGQPAVNPKVGRVVGSIGIWNGTDVVSAPVARILQQPGPPYFPATGELEAEERRHLRVKTHDDVERVVTPGNLLHATNAEVACVKNMGPAAAVVLGNRVALDLNTAFPEITCDPTATGDPFQKYDFGTVNLELVDGSGSVAVLGSVQYDVQTYQQLGGVWEVPFDPASEAGQHISDGFFQLRDEAGTVLLREVDVAQIVTDDQAVYLDLVQTGDGLKAAGTAELRVFAKGEPITEPIRISVERWNDVQNPGKANSVNPLVVTATEIGEERSADVFTLDVPAGGRVDVPVEADRPGCYKLRYIAPGMDVSPSQPAWAVEYFSCFRVLPYDDYSHVADTDLTFDFVYDEVFSYYSILFPVMARIIPWGPANTPHDPERVEQFASLILQAVDESRLGTALEMPITRELSAGKRALLQRWCALQLQG